MSSFNWLEIGRLIYKSQFVKGRVTLPFLSENASLFRFDLPDCGQFTLEFKINIASFDESLENNTLSVIFFENFVAEELKTKGIGLFPWKGKHLLDLNSCLILTTKPFLLMSKKARVRCRL